MATGALHVAVRSRQTESRCCVFERSRKPGGLPVAVHTLTAHFAEMKIILLVTPDAIDARALKLCIGSMAIGAAESVMRSLQFEIADIVNLFSEFHRKRLSRVAGRASRAIFSIVNIHMAVRAL